MHGKRDRGCRGGALGRTTDESCDHAAVIEVATAGGTARVVITAPAAERTGAAGPTGTVVLTHGAGGGNGSPDLAALASASADAGFTIAAVEQPYRVAGRRSPPQPAAQDAAWLEVVAALPLTRPLILAGRSNGARVACRTAGALEAAAVIALAFPVHPPGRPDRDRLGELGAPTCPVVVVQGERDPFGMPGRAAGRRVVVVPGADHALRGAAPVIAREVRALIRRLRAGA